MPHLTIFILLDQKNPSRLGLKMLGTKLGQHHFTAGCLGCFADHFKSDLFSLMPFLSSFYKAKGYAANLASPFLMF